MFLPEPKSLNLVFIETVVSTLLSYQIKVVGEVLIRLGTRVSYYTRVHYSSFR